LSEYRIFETRQFQKDLAAIARSGSGAVEEKLRQVVYPALRHEPHFGPHVKKLKAYQPETWRYRIGSWRFFYEIDEAEKVLYLIAAAHRGSAY
jgi:mRNA interferase RelE/StbE